MSRPLCLAAPALRAALARPATAAKTQAVLPSRRTFISLPTLRPSLAAPRPASTVFRSGQSSTPAGLYTPSPSSSAAATSLDAEVVDIVPRTAISASPLFGGVQIRCGPRPTLARSSRLIRKRRHGFLSRIRTRNGRNTLQRRKSKSRHVLSM